MSTILDALRKVEEEKRTQEADLRVRLLSPSSSRFDFRTRRRSRTPWIVSGGLVMVGALLGAGMMMWRISQSSGGESAVIPTTTSLPQVASVAPQPPTAPPQSSASSAAQSPGTNGPGQASDRARPTAEAVKPTPHVHITPNAPGLVLPQEPRTNVAPAPVAQPTVAASRTLGVGEAFPNYDAWHGGTPQSTLGDNTVGRRGSGPAQEGEVIQRSPFVNSSPYDRIVAPPPLPAPSAPRVTTSPRVAAQRPQATEERRTKATPAPALRNETTQAVTRSRGTTTPAVTQGEPAGAPPGASLSFLQWSADPEKRVASIKVGSGPATIAHEGDSIDGMTIEKIRPDAVELRSGGSRYLLKAR